MTPLSRYALFLAGVFALLGAYAGLWAYPALRPVLRQWEMTGLPLGLLVLLAAAWWLLLAAISRRGKNQGKD